MKFWHRRDMPGGGRKPEVDEEEVSRPFIAAGDFSPGDRLTFYGNYLYGWDPGGALPVVFIARRAIRAGEKVWNDPTRAEISDLQIVISAGVGQRYE